MFIENLEEDKLDMFGGRDISTIKTEEKKISSLTRQLRDISYQPQNPFREYVKFDGNVRIIYICYITITLKNSQNIHSF